MYIYHYIRITSPSSSQLFDNASPLRSWGRLFLVWSALVFLHVAAKSVFFSRSLRSNQTVLRSNWRSYLCRILWFSLLIIYIRCQCMLSQAPIIHVVLVFGTWGDSMRQWLQRCGWGHVLAMLWNEGRGTWRSKRCNWKVKLDEIKNHRVIELIEINQRVVMKTCCFSLGVGKNLKEQRTREWWEIKIHWNSRPRSSLELLGHHQAGCCQWHEAIADFQRTLGPSGAIWGPCIGPGRFGSD